MGVIEVIDARSGARECGPGGIGGPSRPDLNGETQMADTTSKDPSATWRELISTWEKNVNSIANQTMASEEFSGASNQMMNATLKVQQAMGSAMATYLATLNLPSRADIIALGERLQAMETYLSRIALALEETRPVATRKRPATKVARRNRPPRTKRPPSLADQA